MTSKTVKNLITKWETKGLNIEDANHLISVLISDHPKPSLAPTAPQSTHSGSKYLRRVQLLFNKFIDVYCVLEAFSVSCPARQHAIKKLLCAGLRGKADELQDLKEASDAVARAIQMAEERLSQVQPEVPNPPQAPGDLEKFCREPS